MRPHQAVIFDMDGVLVDSEPLHHRASQLALGDRGPSCTARDHLAFRGMTDDDLGRLLCVLFDAPRPALELLADRQRHLVELISREATPRPGVPDVVLALRARGLRLALVSRSARVVIRAWLLRLGLEEAFQAVVSGPEVARGKPAPDGFLMASRRLAVDPESCLVVEDSTDGVLAARAAGMTVVAIPCPTPHDPARRDWARAHLVLPALELLPQALEPIW